MNQAEIIDAEVVPSTQKLPMGETARHPQGWRRFVAALGLLILLGATGGGVWIFGILMFTFSLDSVNSADLPSWLDIFMLIGWPISIGLFAVVPAVMAACGASWKKIGATTIAMGLVSVAVFMTGVVTVILAVS